MLEQSKEYLAAVKSPQRQVDARFTLNNRVYTGRQLAKLDYDQAIVSGTSFSFGGAYVAGLTVEIKELVEGLMEMMPTTAEIGILVDGAMKYKPLGQFFITDIELDRNANSTKLKLQDGFCKLNGEYQSRLSYPATARAVFSEICQRCNISTMPMNIPDTIILGTKLEKTSYREAIQYIAQLVGSYAIFNRKGQLEFRNIQKLSYRVNRDNYVMGGFKRKEIQFRLNGIECEVSNNQKLITGTSSGNVAKLNNPWMTQMYLDELFSKVQGFQFYPYSLNFQGDPCLDVGDWIEVEFSKGEYFQAPILVQKISFDGGLHSEIAANTTGVSDTVYQYKSPLARKVEYLEGRISADGLSQVYSGLDEPNPAHLKKGDTWFKPNGTDIDILMWDGNRWVVHNSREKFDELKREFEDQEQYFDELKKKFAEQEKFFKDLDLEFENSKQILADAKADLDNAKLELKANKQSIAANDKLIAESTNAIKSMRDKFNQVDKTLESQQGLFEEFGTELRNNISLTEELDKKSISFESNLRGIQSDTKDLTDSYRGIYDKTRDLENIFENLSYSGENYFSRLGLSNCSPNKGVAFDSVTNEVTLGKYGTHSFTQFYNMLKPMKDFVGKHVMLSFDAISPNGKARIRPYNNVSRSKYVMQPLLLNDNNIVDNEWKHFDYKIDVVETNDTNELESNKILFFANDQNGVKIRNVDFYIGDKPRDYRAPTLDLEILTRGKITDVEHRLVEEDNKIRNYFTGQIQSLNGDISTAKTAITQELNRYKAEMAEKNNNQDIKYSSLEQTVGNFKVEMAQKNKDQDSKYSSLEQTVNGFKTTVSSVSNEQGTMKNRISALEQTDTAIKSSITAVDKRVGSILYNGDNILSKEYIDSKISKNIKDATSTSATMICESGKYANLYLLLTGYIYPGMEYEISFECSGVQDGDVLVIGLGGTGSENPKMTLKNGANKAKFIYSNIYSSNRMGLHYVYFSSKLSGRRDIVLSNFKLYPTGLGHAILTTNSNITQTAEGIRSEVTKKITAVDGRISTLSNTVTQTAEGIKTEINKKINTVDGRVTTLNNTLTRTAEGIRSEVTQKISGIDGKISTLSNTVTQTANSWSVKNIKNAKEIVSQINLNGADVYIHGKNIALDGNAHIVNGTIKTAHIGDAQITNTKIGNAAITSAKIQDASIVNAKIAAAAITNAKIANATITGAKIAYATITNANIASATIGAAEIKDAAIINAKIANGAITSAKIGNAQILSAHIKDASITNAKIANLDASKITTGTMSADRIYGGIINAKNGAMRINLNSSNIEFNYSSSINFKSGSNAIKRIRNGCTGFLHFNDDAYGGVYVGLGVTSSNEGLNSQNTSRFAGVRIFRPNDNVDKVEMYGDEITFSHAFDPNAHALIMDPLKFSRNFTMSEIINSISSLWRCWAHLNNTRWTIDDNFANAVWNEYNSYRL